MTCPRLTAAPGPMPGSQSCGQAGECDEVFSYPMFRDLERASSQFSGVAAHVISGANVAYHGQTLHGDVMFVSGSYFPVLGLQPALGRLLGPNDDRTVGAHFAVVLAHGFWETQLGASPDVLDQTIVVNGKSLTIIGVAPRGFEGTTLGAEPKLFVPITMRSVVGIADTTSFERRRNYWAYLFARLKPGATIESAKAAINTVYRPILADVEAPLQQGMSPQTMERFKAKEIKIADGRRGQSSVHVQARTPLLLLFATTGIVLLIACANIANLLLARGAGRSTEMAVRLSLGATRARIVSQLLTESCLLALLGGAAGFVVARWTLGLVMALLPGEAAAALHFSLSGSAVLFTVVAT